MKTSTTNIFSYTVLTRLKMMLQKLPDSLCESACVLFFKNTLSKYNF